MAKKLKKKDMDQELLNALYQVEGEWRQLRGFCAKKYRPVTQWDERRVISEIQIFDAVERSSYSQG